MIMKTIVTTVSALAVAMMLSACGSTEKETTIVHERPVVVQPVVSGTMPVDAVEANCAHGYDIKTHSCY